MKKLFFLLPLLGFLLITACKQEGENTTDTVKKEVVPEKKKEAKEVESKSAEGFPEKTYSQVEVMPRFPGCENKAVGYKELVLCANTRLSNYIYNRLRYPKDAMEANVEGIITARFVVRPDGLLDDIAIHNDLGYGTGDHVIRIIESMNRMPERWIPGQHQGKDVRVRLALPIEFRMKKYDQ